MLSKFIKEVYQSLLFLLELLFLGLVENWIATMKTDKKYKLPSKLESTVAFKNAYSIYVSCISFTKLCK